jgi:NAD(P)H dehydrogenase (quinone)
MRVAILGGNGKTGRSIGNALLARHISVMPLGRADDLTVALPGCDAAYLIAPNLHPDEPAYVAAALAALIDAGVPRVVYHSVASPYLPALPHHLGKAVSEDLVRRSGLAWTILQPGVYLQNFNRSRPVEVPYSPHVRFGFLDLHDLGRVMVRVLTEPGHEGATYELASRVASVAELAAEWGVTATQVADPGLHPWLSAMFEYYDAHGLLVGTLPLRALLDGPVHG